QHAASFDAEDTAEEKLNKLEAALQLIGESASETFALFAELMDLPRDRYLPLTSDPKERRKLTLDAIAGQLERVAAQRPVLAVVEDAQWSDPSSLELLDIVVERIAHLPVLQLITFRPEFEPPWAGLAHVTLLLLNRLGTQHTAELAKGVAGGKLLPSE